MKHLVDKLLILLGCCALLGPAVPSALAIAGLLVGVVASALFELVPAPGRAALPLALCLLVAALPSLPPEVLPLALYDLTRVVLVQRAPWVTWGCVAAAALPVAATLERSGLVAAQSTFAEALGAVAPVAILAAIASLLASRTTHSLAEQRELTQLRDTLQESVLRLRHRNEELKEARAYQERAATLAERARIAREIHDNVGHLLTRSIFQVEALQIVHGFDALGAELQPVNATLHEALDTVRTSVHNLHDESIDLEVQLASLARAYPRGEVDLLYTADEPAPPPIANCLASIAREALANAARHGQATHVSVAVEEHPGFWRMRITDNGHTAQSSSPGLGLQSMRERAKALGGTFWANPTAEGYTVFVTIPKQPRSSHDPH